MNGQVLTFAALWMDVEGLRVQARARNAPFRGKCLTTFLAIWLQVCPPAASARVRAGSDGYAGQPQTPGVRVWS
jgi:hypothetical protein